MLEQLAKATATVAMRLHAGIFSASLGIVPTMVSYDEKVTAFAESIGSIALHIEQLTADALWSAFVESQATASQLVAMVRERREIGVRRAAINIAMLEESLRPVNTR
jgi:polysaccharide pyruvyl transferase WcaK-like protein